MTDDSKPYRVLLGMRELLMLACIIFAAGGGWIMLQANAENIRDNTTLNTFQETRITILEEHDLRKEDDIAEIKVDQRTFNAEQRLQSRQLYEILAELKKLNGSPN